MAIQTMKEGEPATISITNPIYAYGIEGVPPFVPSNSRISIDLEIINIDEDRPRTTAAIAAAYDRRIKDKAMEGLLEEREGIDGFIDWIRGSYFFGLFKGETGQVAPWYLTPSIGSDGLVW